MRSLQPGKCSSARAKTSVTVEEVEDHRLDLSRDTGGEEVRAREATQQAC